MTTQQHLIDAIERISPVLDGMPESEIKGDLSAKLNGWKSELNAINASSTTPTCPTGTYWNGSKCVDNVG